MDSRFTELNLVAKQWFIDYHALWKLRLTFMLLPLCSFFFILQANNSGWRTCRTQQRLSFQSWKGSSSNRWGSSNSSCYFNFSLKVSLLFYIFFYLFTDHALGCKDKHVIDLANEVRRILEEEQWMLHSDVALYYVLNTLETSALPRLFFGR